MSFVERAMDATFQHEGGYVNNPNDLGGETNWGITVAVARAYGYTGPMREMTREQAKKIYAQKYWHSQRLDQIASISFEVAAEIYDTGVNMGETWGATFLQRALNVFNLQSKKYPDMTVDGRIGPMTIEAFKAFHQYRGEAGVRVLLKTLNSLQGARYVELAEARAKNEEFVYGWMANRVGL